MAKTLKKDTVSSIEQAIWAAWNANRYPDLHAIAEMFNTSYQSVCYIRRRIEKHQRTGVDDRRKPGRKPISESNQIVNAILDLLARSPELNQKAVSDVLYEQFGKRLCQASISRIYKKHGIPHKISNKFYKKSKLFTTNPMGQVTVADNSREIAASALSSLPTAVVASLQADAQSTYKSPYGSGQLTGATFEVAHGVSPVNSGYEGMSSLYFPKTITTS